MRLLHSHGRVVGWQRTGKTFHVLMWLYRLAEHRARCPGGSACTDRHEIEHLEYLVHGRSQRWWKFR